MRRVEVVAGVGQPVSVFGDRHGIRAEPGNDRVLDRVSQRGDDVRDRSSRRQEESSSTYVPINAGKNQYAYCGPYPGPSATTIMRTVATTRNNAPAGAALPPEPAAKPNERHNDRDREHALVEQARIDAGHFPEPSGQAEEVVRPGFRPPAKNPRVERYVIT